MSYDDYIYKHSIAVDKFWDEEVVDKIISHIKPNTDILDNRSCHSRCNTKSRKTKYTFQYHPLLRM